MVTPGTELCFKMAMTGIVFHFLSVCLPHSTDLGIRQMFKYVNQVNKIPGDLTDIHIYTIACEYHPLNIQIIPAG